MPTQVLLAIAVALAMCHSTAHGAAPPPGTSSLPAAPSPGTTLPAAPSPRTTLPPAPSPNATQEFLDAHNEARAEVGVGPLKWSDKLANATSLLVRYQRDKAGCKFADLSSGKYGGNQLWASGLTVTPRVAVESWMAEKKYYDHANNSCAAQHRCGVYTQVVWRKSADLGCAQAGCGKEDATLVICFYYPPGNVIGESPY